MNHRGKNNRNHEYQDSKDSASTPEFKQIEEIQFNKMKTTLRCHTRYKLELRVLKIRQI